MPCLGTHLPRGVIISGYSAHSETRGCAPFALGLSTPFEGVRRILLCVPFALLIHLVEEILHELQCIHWCMKHGQGVSEDVIDNIHHPDHEEHTHEVDYEDE